MTHHIPRILTCSILILLVFGKPAGAETVTFPLSLEYPLLQTLTKAGAYTESNGQAIVLNENDGCQMVTLSEPKFSTENNLVRFENRLTVRLGTSMGGACIAPIEWEGRLVLWQIPQIDSSDWTLRFITKNSELLTLNGEPAKMAGIVWNFAKESVYATIENFSIHLAPPITELKQFLLPLFPKSGQERATRLVNSLRAGKIHINQGGIKADILADVLIPPVSNATEERRYLSGIELDEFMKLWDLWDAYLLHIITALADKPLSEDERLILLDTLLDVRYRLSEGVSNGQINNDFVRSEFITTWQSMAPIFRNHLNSSSSESILGYLAFFTAADALSTLDKLGPTLGIEISRNGLIRLARLVNQNPLNSDTLNQVQHGLRQVLGFPALEEDPEVSPIQPLPGMPIQPLLEELPSPPDRVKPLSIIFLDTILSNAKASEKKQAGLSNIRKWLPKTDNLTPFIRQVTSALDKKAQSLPVDKMRAVDKKFFSRLVKATAWQESCFRQFHIRNNQIVFLRSYNGSSVGIMQVNERVWRGLYSLDRLRWDIHYNINAGCEILQQYLQRYALKKLQAMKMDRRINSETLAQIVYAMYNGGPGQFKRFLERKKKGNFYQSDKLFQEKYRWVLNSQWDMIDHCLIGS